MIFQIHKKRNKLGGKMKTKQTQKNESSQKLTDFLSKNDVHKKDFAQMIGVTLSYVYSLIDNTIPFSTRATTLERIATVMGIPPEEFVEYKSSGEPRIIDSGVKFLQNKQKKLNMTNVQFLKNFPRQKRSEIVDIWRGALPMPLDFEYLKSICDVLKVKPQEIYPYWEARMRQYLMASGIDLFVNADLIDSMFDGAKKYLKI